MSTKHTPGPWRYAGRDERGLPHSLVAADTLLARVYSKHYRDVDEEKANARLIAAAPDLLEALRRYVAADDEVCNDTIGGDIRDQARAAIAKATGAEV